MTTTGSRRPSGGTSSAAGGRRLHHHDGSGPTTSSSSSGGGNSSGSTGGPLAILPSLVGLAVLAVAVLAQSGFRGRASMVGIDLGTTNSVVCVQSSPLRPSSSSTSRILQYLSRQHVLLATLCSSFSESTLDSSQVTADDDDENRSSGVATIGSITCIVDPASGTPLVPSVVSFLDHAPNVDSSWIHRIPWFKSSRRKLPLDPAAKLARDHGVVVGGAAKRRIDTHPAHTLYHAKRVLGRSYHDPAVQQLQQEVEFKVMSSSTTTQPVFSVPIHHDNDASSTSIEHRLVTPGQVGTYIVSYLMLMVQAALGHANARSAVICVPAKFTANQIAATKAAVEAAGVTVVRILQEPTAAALAYGLHRKPAVQYILVYDFGGGTLDVSLLRVAEGGYIDVVGSDGDENLGGADFDAAVARGWLQNVQYQGHVHQITQGLSALQQSSAPELTIDDLDDALVQAACPALRDEIPLCTASSLHSMAEQVKIALSASSSPEMMAQASCLTLSTVQTPWTVADFCAALQPVNLVLTAAQYDEMAQPLYERAIRPVTRLLHDLHIATHEIDEVVMVGGSTRMPAIRAQVRQALPTSQINTRIDPDITVAYGAASIFD
jgi:molecular chaperone DnaK (HSP70)